MKGISIYKGDRNSFGTKVDNEQNDNLIDYLRNKLGRFLGRDVNIRNGGNRFRKKNGKVWVVDKDDDNAEMEIKAKRNKMRADPNIVILEEKGDTIVWRWKV